MVNEFKYIKSRKNTTDIKDWRERRKKEEEQKIKLKEIRKKPRYEEICKAIVKVAKGRKRPWNDLMVDYIMVQEFGKVEGFDRDEFMEDMIKVKKEAKLKC